ncbi:hypothetical protein THRCLA_02413 [Thraustotheca clavata]|uniref:Uncharacterized protein n=1 Tax=Thraustotheca clavata TaxID=74557 RepID=A0A1W0A5D8_9STRA|nr:hypothetical protein THRCLA_02413 [Thraustotheca clavata]
MPIDLQALRGTIEASIEELIRRADSKINWTNGSGKGYLFLPGVYQWHADKSEHVAPIEQPPVEQPLEVDPEVATAAEPEAILREPNEQEKQETVDVNVKPNEPIDEEKHFDRELAQVAAFLMNDDDIVSMSFTLTLHQDNQFEYVWKQKRAGTRPMEHKVELMGTWSKPVLNRDRYGERDNRLFLETSRARFVRYANQDPVTGAWRQTLRTLTRNGEDYVVCGHNDRGLPPIRMVFSVLEGNVLESTGLTFPHDIISNSISSRILSGLTKKAANKLGSPLDVMTDRWLPCRKLCLKQLSPPSDVKPFNPFLA